MSSRSICVVAGVRASFRVGLGNNPWHVCFLFEIKSIMTGARVDTEDMAWGTRRVEAQEPVLVRVRRGGEKAGRHWREDLQTAGWLACCFSLNWGLNCKELFGVPGRMRRLSLFLRLMVSACALSSSCEVQATPVCELLTYHFLFLLVGGSLCYCCVDTHFIFAMALDIEFAVIFAWFLGRRKSQVRFWLICCPHCSIIPGVELIMQ